MKSIIAIVSVLCLLLTTGCASNPTGSLYSMQEARQVQRVQLGTVYSVRDVTIEGNGMAGTVVGGVLGAVGGSTMGAGTGKTLMTILGGVGGAVAGNKVSKSMSGSNGVEITVRLENGELLAITQAKEENVVFRAGDRVRLMTQGRTTRVILG